MSGRHRAVFFWGLVLVFLLVLPTMIFYTTGYRLSFEDDVTTVVTTGGVYVSTQSLDVDVYLDEEQVERPRLFRSAYYIQNIDAGLRRIVVQGDDVQTWVKLVPVDSRIVTEAAAFNLPTIPQLRPITQWQTTDGAAVYQAVQASSTIFGSGTSTEEFVLSTTSASLASYTVNPEYEFVETLFGSTTATTTSRSVFAQFRQNQDRFRFASPQDAVVTTSTSTPMIIERNDVQLLSRAEELYAVWRGSQNDVPYYFCITNTNASTTAARYGEHVAAAVYATSTATSSPIFMVDDRTCRSEIKLDRLRQDVYLFDFFPGSSDLVLLHLQDGLYVTEIDDRSWQNTQPLYLGGDFQTIVENDVIYIKQNNNYFEIIPEIES